MLEDLASPVNKLKNEMSMTESGGRSRGGSGSGSRGQSSSRSRARGIV